MTMKSLVSTLLALFLVSGELAFAQTYGDRSDRNRSEATQRDDYRDGRNYDRNYDRNDGRYDGRNYTNRQYDRNDYRGRGGYDRRDGRGAGPSHSFYRGQRLPARYHHRQYVVDDWRGHRLHSPPRGYHWVQSGGDYLLVAIASGIIARILLDY